MHYAKTQLLRDTFYFKHRASYKPKSPTLPKGTKPARPKQTVPKKSAIKVPRPRLTEEQKRERSRVQAKERFWRRKELGLCKDCPDEAIKGQIRCLDCVEKHRTQQRQKAEKVRTAMGKMPRPRIEDSELMEALRNEIGERVNQGKAQQPRKVLSEEYKKKQRDIQASLRAERLSLGLCRDCGKPSLQGQTRCQACVLRHRQYALRGRTKAKVLKEVREAGKPATI